LSALADARRDGLRNVRLNLKPGGIFVSSDGGPWFQNAVLPLVTPLVGRFLDGKKVVFPFPKIDQAMVRRFLGGERRTPVSGRG